MDFQTDYWHALDKTVAERYEINPKTIGISHGIGDVARGLKANVFAGAKVVELGFMGVGKGSRSTPTGVTPELFGKTEREDMRAMAKINEVVVTTHATANVQGFAGLDPQKGGFKEEKRQEALHEIERAIDFAADVAQGGPVVVHAGEFPRSIVEADKKFKAYREEEARAPVYFVNKITGNLQGVERDKHIPFADFDYQKKEYKRDPKTGEISIKMLSYNDFKKEFDALPEDKKEEYGSAENFFYHRYRDDEISRYRAEAQHFDSLAESFRRRLERIKGGQEWFEKRKEEKVTPDLVKEFAENNPKFFAGMDPREANEAILEISENPKDYFKKSTEQFKELRNHYEEGAAGYLRGVKAAEEEIKNIVPVKDYAIEKSAETIARAALTAFDREKSQDLKKPLFIAPENIFPESYGAHPQELKNLILESRAEMAKKLQEERRISKTEADKIAAEHIKATFDIGHAYTWKKYFEKLSGETSEQTEKRFKKWMDDQVTDLQKAGIIGHVHLSDNFGYYDEHVTPGEGTAPIKELVEKLQKEKFKGVMVVEPGAQPEGQIFEALRGAWRTLSSPAYRLDTMGLSWTDVEGSYFGRTGSPTYVVGDYAPSKDWTLWSEAPLE